MRAPEFWRGDRRGTGARLTRLALTPASWLFQAGAWLRRRATRPCVAGVPVVCIGNLVAGGAGKTPAALALARAFVREDLRVHFLARGYGGREAGPIRVDPERHVAGEVGDEALLLARVAPTWIARDRKAGIAAAAESGPDLVIMDDGFQNPAVRPDASLLVFDGGYGLGNNRTLPAGPLRESLASGLARTAAAMIVGPDETGLAGRLGGVPLFEAEIRPDPVAAHRLQGRRVVAIAGIGRPEKFFGTLAGLGATIVARHAFADHHPFDARTLDRILAEAQSLDATIVTTEKDAARLPTAYRARIETLPVTLEIRDLARLLALIRTKIGMPGNGRPA